MIPDDNSIDSVSALKELAIKMYELIIDMWRDERKHINCYSATAGFRIENGWPNISTVGRSAWKKRLVRYHRVALINSRSEENGRPIGNGSNNSYQRDNDLSFTARCIITEQSLIFITKKLDNTSYITIILMG